MRPRPMLPLGFLLAAAVLALALPDRGQAEEAEVTPAPFPLPLVGGKPVSIAPGQRTFRLPLGFARVIRFYRDQFRGVAGVKLTERSPHGEPRELTLRSLRPGDAWARAEVREVETGTTVVVTPVIRADMQEVQGAARPLVEISIGRSEEARRAVESIEHLER